MRASGASSIELLQIVAHSSRRFRGRASLELRCRRLLLQTGCLAQRGGALELLGHPHPCAHGGVLDHLRNVGARMNLMSSRQVDSLSFACRCRDECSAARVMREAMEHTPPGFKERSIECGSGLCAFWWVVGWSGCTACRDRRASWIRWGTGTGEHNIRNVQCAY